VNFGSVTPEFNIGKDVHSLVDQQFGSVRFAAPLLHLAGISTEFCGAISTQFCFSYSIEGVIVLPRGQHAGLFHAFLVYLFSELADA